MNDEASEIVRNLDALGVPGTGLSWDRVVAFAQGYAKGNVAVTQPEPVNQGQLSDDQTRAWLKLKDWATQRADIAPYFVLRGFAGTGKTFLMRMLKQSGAKMLFTAPTNKATKVLSKSVGQDCKTTFSQLGLRMVTKDDELVMEYTDKRPYIARGSILVVDEASMVGRELYQFIDRARQESNFKVLYVGDPAQLPPVQERRSPSWKATENPEHRAMLKQVMRYDNQLLKVSTDLRNCVINQDWQSPIIDDNANDEGVFVLSGREFRQKLLEFTSPEDFISRKVLAWRNARVNRYNEMIRRNFGFEQPYAVGDVLLISEPVQHDGVIVAQIDDEYVVERVTQGSAKVDDVIIDTYDLKVRDDENKSLLLRIPVDATELDSILSRKAHVARTAKGFQRSKLWKDFWETKARFNAVRYGYAITVHRAQGSTYTEVYVDQEDILANRNEREAFRCLYVAATRATTRMFTY